jgi:hypothetical protein
MTGILFSFPGDWRRQILKIVLELPMNTRSMSLAINVL